MSLRKEAVAGASSTKMSGVVEHRCRRGADRLRSRFSVPWSDGEAQEAQGQSKKTTVWGKKEKFTPTALFIYLRVRVVGVVVLHYPDRFRGELPHGGTEWGGGYCNRATRQ
jgi:hypothetical protein